MWGSVPPPPTNIKNISHIWKSQSTVSSCGVAQLTSDIYGYTVSSFHAGSSIIFNTVFDYH